MGENISKKKNLMKYWYLNYTENYKNSTIRKQTTWLKNGPKPQIDTSPKKTDRCQRSIWKESPHHVSWGNCKLKQDTHYTRTRKAKMQTLETPNSGEHLEQHKLSSIDGDNAEWYSHFGRVWSFLQNETTLNHRIQQMSWKFMFIYKFHRDVYSNFIHNY